MILQAVSPSPSYQCLFIGSYELRGKLHVSRPWNHLSDKIRASELVDIQPTDAKGPRSKVLASALKSRRCCSSSMVYRSRILPALTVPDIQNHNARN